MIDKNFWKDKNVLVTGFSGFLGSWVSEALVDAGACVVGLLRDRVPRSKVFLSKAINKIVVVNGKIEDYDLLERILNEYEIEVVFHLAAQTLVSIANRNPLSTFEANTKGTWSILEACRRNRTVKSILVASSDKAYGDQERLPYNEQTPLQGRHPYDVSKSCADLIAQSYFNTYALPICITRCGNFYGGGDLNFDRIIPGVIRSILKGEAPIIRSDGSFIRDYFYIKDAVNAYLFLAQKMSELEIKGEAFNFSNEIQADVLVVTRKILRLMKREDLKPVILNEAKGEIKHQYLSAKKAKQTLGWTAKYSLEEGLKETIDWYTNFLK
ncbi:MAG: GDP-mannose 4,6-dehydratase [Candidatus Saganbacteria bacterium]|nr:GDP-mannose 4,6-dehydratase [Candidatus Saganbacteria bacterium]